MVGDERVPDASEDVMRMIALAAHAPTTDEIVDGLKAKHSEAAVLNALEHWHREIDAEQGVDDRWYWRGLPSPPSGSESYARDCGRTRSNRRRHGPIPTSHPLPPGSA